MSNNHFYRHWLVCAFTFAAGFGLAVVLPLAASSQRAAAKSAAGAQNDAPQGTQIYYVAISGTGSPGTSWNNAFTNLQDALDVAEDPSEIWVAEGVYYPDIGSTQINNSVTATFLMTDGVAIYGGFKFGDAQLSDRDWINNRTVLSGDIDGNDSSMDGIVMAASDIAGKNAYHVVTARGVTETAVLDGFTITAGNANNENTGMWDIYFSDADGGGILCFDGCFIRLSNMIFSGNKAKWSGGGMYVFAHEFNNSLSLRNVTFYGNSALEGGAIHSEAQLYGSNTLNLINAAFTKNEAAVNGGAISQYGFAKAYSNSTLIIKNAAFSGNSAGEFGGAVSNDYTSFLDVVNSIIWDNQDSSGRGTLTSSIYMFPDYPDLYHGAVYLGNSLVQGTGGSRNWTSDDRFTDRGGNIDTNPLFEKDPLLPAGSGAAGNLRLDDSSPAIDAGDNTEIAGLLEDLDGKPRIQDGDGDGVGTVDMGACESKAKTERHYILNVFRTGPKDSRVLSSPAGIDCGDTCSLLLRVDSKYSLMPAPQDHLRFAGWSGACTGAGDCEVIMEGSKSVTAHFLALNLFPFIPR